MFNLKKDFPSGIYLKEKNAKREIFYFGVHEGNLDDNYKSNNESEVQKLIKLLNFVDK